MTSGMRQLGSVLFTVSVALLGCDGVDSTVDDFTQSKALTLLEGPDLVSCRVEKGMGDDPFFRSDQVLCKLAPKTDFPLKAARVFVAVTSAKGSAGSTDVTSEDEVVVAKVFADAYPLDVEIGASYSQSDAGDLAGLGSGFFNSFTSHHAIVAPTADVLTARFPFDLWPVEIRASKAEFQGSLSPFKLDLAPMKTSSGSETLDVRASLGVLALGKTKRSLIPVTRGTTRLTGEGSFDGEKLPFDLTGPGAYVAEPSGLRGATEADLTDISGGPTFATCWTEPSVSAGQTDVLCSRGDIAGVSFSALEVLVGDDLATASVGGDLTGTAPVKVATTSTFPVTVWARATIAAPDVVGLAEWQSKEPLTVGAVVAQDATLSSPQAIALPFDVWPITVDAAEGSFLCDLDPYAVPLGVEWGGVALVKVEGASTPFVNEGEQATFFVVADSRAESLHCKGLIVTNSGDVTENLEVSLVRGGSYRVTGKTLAAQP
jgi:hypothetical protein